MYFIDQITQLINPFLEFLTFFVVGRIYNGSKGIKIYGKIINWKKKTDLGDVIINARLIK